MFGMELQPHSKAWYHILFCALMRCEWMKLNQKTVQLQLNANNTKEIMSNKQLCL